jgi:metal-responsive CopG/Arc/MetJ family transcriptional regulator
MKTIRVAIDEQLLAAVDEATARLQTTRSAFIRSALLRAVRHHKIDQMEQQHAAGYTRQPVVAGEFDIWEAERQWGPGFDLVE